MTNEGPLFSVIIPTYDRPQLLNEAVASVLSQTAGDLECLVVDDGGTVTVHLPSDSRVRIVRRPVSGGPAAARNSGIEAARGRFVTFLDDDDLYLPHRLADSLRLLERNPVVTCWRTGGYRVLEGDVSDVILDDLVPHVGQVAVRRDVVPPFDEFLRASEDVEWWLRLARISEVRTVQRVGYQYRYHPGPRHGIGAVARVEGLKAILDAESSYFSSHPRAEAFQWKQIGLAERRLGNRRSAIRAFWRSLLLAPSAKTLWHIMRASFA